MTTGGYGDNYVSHRLTCSVNISCINKVFILLRAFALTAAWKVNDTTQIVFKSTKTQASEFGQTAHH